MRGTRRDPQQHREDQLILSFIGLFGSSMELLSDSHFYFLRLIVPSAFLLHIILFFFHLPLVFPRVGKHNSTLCLRKSAVQYNLTELSVQIGWGVTCFWYHQAGDHEICPRVLSHLHYSGHDKQICAGVDVC